MKMQELINLKRKERIDMLNDELERIRKEFISMGAEKIIVFGSAARGELTIFSDLDVIVVMKTDIDFIKRLRCMYEKLKPRSVDILIYTPEEIEAEGNVFIKNALREGKIVYEKKS